MAEKKKIELHIFRVHLDIEQSPYYCSLCKYRCLTKRELDRHSGFQGHIEMLKFMRDLGMRADPMSHLKTSEAPYTITNVDLVRLERNESRAVWNARTTANHDIELNCQLQRIEGIHSNDPLGLLSNTTMAESIPQTDLKVTVDIQGMGPATVTSSETSDSLAEEVGYQDVIMIEDSSSSPLDSAFTKMKRSPSPSYSVNTKAEEPSGSTSAILSIPDVTSESEILAELPDLSLEMVQPGYICNTPEHHSEPSTIQDCRNCNKNSRKLDDILSLMQRLEREMGKVRNQVERNGRAIRRIEDTMTPPAPTKRPAQNDFRRYNPIPYKRRR